MPDAGPSQHAARILLVDAAAPAAEALAAQLRGALQLEPVLVHALAGRAAAERLRVGRFDLIVAELSALSDLDREVEEAMARLVRLSGGALVVAISDGASVSAAMAAMRGGAHDYLVRPFGGEALAARLRELADRHGRQGLFAMAFRSDPARPRLAGLVGSSSQMQVVFDLIERSALSDAPVFITGEGGTGKSLTAAALHAGGERVERPLVTVACVAVARDDLARQLFGTPDAAGAIERANGGTLFVDEIGDLDPVLQARLLQFLQTGAVGRGEIDVRVVCATSHNPMQLISERRLREDLFYRLHVLPIHLPPLRQRTGDAAELAGHFLARFSAEERREFTEFSPDALSLIAAGEWSGNVRQLQNFVRRLVVMYEGGEVDSRMVTDADFEAGLRSAGEIPVARRSVLPMWRQEQRIIEEAIESFAGNIALAAAALELSPSTIYRKRQAWAELDGKRGAA